MVSPIAVVGAGPAGCIAALTLRKLGRSVVLFERALQPEYKIGESFLPGTMSILKRLGVMDRIEQAGFVKKPSATFIWGAAQAPWTFSFATNRPEPWIYDHAMQAYRQEFDGILLESVKAAGADVRLGHNVTDVKDLGAEGVAIDWAVEGGSGGRLAASYLVDCTGQAGLIARRHELRRYDEFYRSIAVWNYFDAKRSFTGDLKGTTFSITFKGGWIWMIPLKDGTYSVGAVVDMASLKEIKELGDEKFLHRCLASAPEVASIVDINKPRRETRIIREWSYDATKFSFGRMFMCGDAACFTDPLFSQGVHLASQSGVSAAAAIDYLIEHPDKQEAVHEWYGSSYRDSYSQYHEFLASFYSYASRLMGQSPFWSKRGVDGLADKRFQDKLWFSTLSGQADGQSEDGVIDEFVERSHNMISIGQHMNKTLTDDFTEAELTAARIKWISQLTRSLEKITTVRWHGKEVKLVPTYKVDPMSFKLREYFIVTNENGVKMAKYPLNEAYREVLGKLNTTPTSYRDLIRQFRSIEEADTSSQLVIRLMEAGLLKGYSSDGAPVHIQKRLRFDGVGAEYEV